MEQILGLLVIDKEYTFSGERKDLLEILQESKVVNFKLLDHPEIKLYPDTSWGTWVFDGINVRITTSASETGKTKVNFKTRVRPEHYFTVVVFIFFFLGAGLTKGQSSGWIFLYIFGLWIVCHTWFQFIYRLQENNLIEKVVKKLGLKKM